MANTKNKTKFTELKALLYIVLFMSIFTNCVGIYSFITDKSSFGDLDLFTQILVGLLIALVWALEPAIKTAWEKVWKGQVRFIGLIIPLTLASIVFTSWGLKHIAINNNSRIEREIIDRSELDSLNTQLHELSAFEDSLSSGKIRAFTSSNGVLYRSGIVKLEQIQDDKRVLEARRDTLEARLIASQLRADNTYNEKVKNFELFATGFSGLFQLVSMILIFLINYNPKKAVLQLPKVPRTKIVKKTPENVKSQLKRVSPEVRTAYKRTIFKEDNLDVVISIILNETGEKLSFRELADKCKTNHSKVQRYTSQLKEIGLI